jgi:hypothetical protein
MSSLEKRLKNLEKRFAGGENIILIMEDGSARRLHSGPPRNDLFKRLWTNPNSVEAELLRRSVIIIEPGDGKMIELARALLLSDIENDNEHRKASYSERNQ